MASKVQPISLWLKAFIPVIVWAGVIFIFSSQSSLPGFDSGALDFIFKKSAHMFVYGVFYWLNFRAIEIVSTQRTNPRVKILVPLLVVLIYAISDEIHQSTVPGRYPTLRDIGFDLLGASLVFFRKFKYI